MGCFGVRRPWRAPPPPPPPWPIGSCCGLILVHGILWVLLKVRGIFFGFHCCPNSIIPLLGIRSTPPPSLGCNVGTIYTPIHQPPTSAVKDTANRLIEHRKLTLPLRPWKIVSPTTHYCTCASSRSSPPKFGERSTLGWQFWNCNFLYITHQLQVWCFALCQQ